MTKHTEIDIRRLAGIFKALSNAHRLRMFLRLKEHAEDGEDGANSVENWPCVGELGEPLSIVPSTVSHHVRELHRSGLIRVERRGQQVCCQVSGAALEELVRLFCIREDETESDGD